jgi:membrane protein involved in colicin uptake
MRRHAVLGKIAQRQQRAFARALRNRWDKAAAAKVAMEKAAEKAAADKAAADKAAAEKAAADKAAADKAMAAFPWYGSGLGVFSHFPLS